MTRWILKFVVVVLCTLTSFRGGSFAQSSDLPVEAFANLPSITMPELSPSGHQLAFVTNRQDQQALIIINLETNEQTAISTENVRPHGIIWVNEETLLLRASRTRRDYRVEGVIDTAGVLKIDLSEAEIEIRQLLTRTRDLGENFSLGEIAGLDRANGYVYMPAFDNERNRNLYRVNIDNGTAIRDRRGNRNTHQWVMNNESEVVARMDRSDARQLYTVLIADGNRWKTAIEQTQALRDFSLINADPENERLLISTRTLGNENTLGLFWMNLEDNTYDTVYQNEKLDISDILTDPYTYELIAVLVEDITIERTWFSQDLQAIHQSIQAHFEHLAMADIFLTSWSEDRTTFSFLVEGSYFSPFYGMYNAETDAVSILGNAYPALENRALPQRLTIEYTARDGVKIPAYLTLPSGEGPHPFVVLPHGGPEARDYSGFDYWAHFLASRGYGVIQPNFRGSTGYGQAYVEAGYGQWGLGVMQNDVSDARNAVVQAGYADSERICIAGGSYGGYAALAGAAFTPELYQCAISFAGVGDLNQLVAYEEDRYGERSEGPAYWRKSMVGDVNADNIRDFLTERSPLHAVENIEIPVLLIHGEEDSVVPAEQSRFMQSALEDAGKPVEYIEIEGGDHWLTNYETRLTMLSQMERFLDEHIGIPPAQ